MIFHMRIRVRIQIHIHTSLGDHNDNLVKPTSTSTFTCSLALTGKKFINTYIHMIKNIRICIDKEVDTESKIAKAQESDMDIDTDL